MNFKNEITSMNKELLISLATTVLYELVGAGRWVVQHGSSRENFERTKDPLLGLAVGDVVYSYDAESDVTCLAEDKVIFVEDDIGYIHFNSSQYGPSLIPVTTTAYAKTKEEAIELWRDHIEADVEYLERSTNILSDLKALLGQSI